MYAIIGLFCVGIILEPLAIARAVKARGLIRTNPNLSGWGKTTAALTIAIIGLTMWVLGILVRIASLA